MMKHPSRIAVEKNIKQLRQNNLEYYRILSVSYYRAYMYRMNTEYFDILDHYLIIRKTNFMSIFDRISKMTEGNVLFSKGILYYILMFFITAILVITMLYDFFFYKLLRNVLIFKKVIKSKPKSAEKYFYHSLRNAD